eukprot:496632_1
MLSLVLLAISITISNTFPNSTGGMQGNMSSCNYFDKINGTLLAQEPVFDAISIINNTLQLQFEIQLQRYCNQSLCNVFYLGNNFSDAFMSLSINTIFDYFELSVKNVYHYHDIYRIPTAKMLLPVDNAYHTIYVSTEHNGKNETQITFSVDDNMYYYQSMFYSLILPNQILPLYISSSMENMNFKIMTFCVNSSNNNNTVGDAFCNGCIGELKCNQAETFLPVDDSYLYLNLSQNFDVVLSANGERWLRLTLMDMNFKFLHSSWCASDYGCSIHTQLVAGEYLVKINLVSSGWNEKYFADYWQIDADCSTEPSRYELVVHDDIYWQHAQYECEFHFGTTLATIITDQDMDDAIHLISRVFPEPNVMLWIGMYKDIANYSKWTWVDGTNCEYTMTGDCGDDEHWIDNQPDIIRHTEQLGAYLLVSDWSNDSTQIGFVDLQFSEWERDGFLCNAQNSKYQIKDCNGMQQCWIPMDCCDDRILTTDAASNPNEFTPPVFFWNNKLFVVGLNEIHYTKIQLFDNMYHWNHKQYNNYNFNTKMTSQRWTQDDSSVYLYVQDQERQHILLHIDLDNFDMEYFSVPGFNSYVFIDAFCMVSSGSFVYVVRGEGIWVFDVTKKSWNTYKGNGLYSFTSTCTITKDGQFIYAFVFEYGIIRIGNKDGSWDWIETENLCYTDFTGLYTHATVARGITTTSGKMYLQGCYVASWKTLIFDPETEEFSTETIDIQNPLSGYIANYRHSQMVVMDDNVLLLLYAHRFGEMSQTQSNESISLYFGLTNIISINFKDTISVKTYVWPSDGFIVKYTMNDFNNSTNDEYGIWFYSNDTTVNINTSITLNSFKDNCICSESFYKCHSCYQHFDLTKHLTLQDNDIKKLTFIPKHSYFLILPEFITIMLQRCEISFTSIDKSITNYDKSMNFYFKLSDECYLKTDKTFYLNIAVAKLNVLDQLIISPTNSTTINCNICRMKNNCSLCYENRFVIRYDIDLEEEREFHIDIASNSIDLYATSVNHTFEYIWTESNMHNTKMNRNFLYLLLLLLLPIMIVCIVARWCKFQYQQAHTVDNVLVLIIGVSQFDDKKKFLPGIKQNVVDLLALWRDTYHYDVFVCNFDTLYCTKKDIIKFVDKHMNKLQQQHYNGAIVHVITHASGNVFLSSDQKEIKMDFISHELISSAEVTDNTTLIKVIFHHGCQGNTDYHLGKILTSNETNTTISTTNINQSSSSLMRTSFVHSTSHKHIHVMTYDSNLVIISGNVAGRAMSDSGEFTKCICESFSANAKRIIKADFNSLFTEIGSNLERKTNHAELCNINGTLRYHSIRFETYGGIKHGQNNNQQIDDISYDKGRTDNYAPLEVVQFDDV